jgi:redox-sensitive bicupin YhaK (pirin superfamily)
MLQLRRAKERGHANHGWLDSYHTFSFADYYDPKHMGFRSLRVINEDRVAPGGGFPTHPHRDMEIVSYVLDGSLQHKDSMGNGSVMRPGDVQRMTAGTGVRHSEFNASQKEPVHFLQIWIVPEKANIAPSYEQKNFSSEEKRGKLRLVASRTGEEGSVVIHQDAKLFAGLFESGEKTTYILAPNRHAWVHVVRGVIILNGETLQAGDAASTDDATQLEIAGASHASSTEQNAEVLLFDLA